MNTNMENIHVYAHGDEADIVQLHQEVFDSKTNIDRWKWQFLSHPKGRGWVSLAKSGSELVGHYCVMRYHLNYLGREVVAAQSCDTMVKADQRGKGWFIKLADHNYKLAQKDGVQAVFGFPNRKSYPGLMKHLEWVRLFNLNAYYCRLGLKKMIGSRCDFFLQGLIRLKIMAVCHLLVKSRVKEARIFSADKIPKDMLDHIEEINAYEVLSIWKDAEYMKWRYENHPQHQYVFHTLFIGAEPDVLMVTRKSNETVYICEILSRTKNILNAVYLVYHVLLGSIHTKAQMVEFYGHDNGFFDSVFRVARFKKVISPFVFGGRVFNNKRLSGFFRIPSNWSISLGDTDVI